MKLLQYFVAFLVFFAGFAIIDANVNGAFKHNVLAGSIGYLLMVSAPAIAFCKKKDLTTGTNGAIITSES